MSVLAVLTSSESSFHHWGAKTEKSCDLGGARLPAEVVGRSARADQRLEVGRGSSIDPLVGLYNPLESDASYYREPVEVPEKGGHTWALCVHFIGGSRTHYA